MQEIRALRYEDGIALALQSELPRWSYPKKQS
jgi:hypothetical protein